MLIIYQIIGYCLLPIVKFNIYLRILSKKEDKDRFAERFGITKLQRPKGKLIWIHAASVGEFKSSTLIIEKLHKKFNILITTTTLTAANYAINNFGSKIIHQYAPLDIRIWVNRFLNKWQPSLVLWIESDLWPITLSTLKEKSIKSFLLNSRISPKSYNKWKYFKNFFQIITNTFEEIYAQSLIDKKRIELLTKKKINYIGNLKLSSIEKYTNIDKINNYKKKLNDFKILMLASTHEGEEKKILHSIKNYLSQHKNIKIIIAPRHPQRSDSIIQIFKKENINYNFFENSTDLKEDVFIINSFGNMAFYYSLSDIVILGGSFIEMGGHNPIEPANNNCVVITGPHNYNWENIFTDMSNCSACIICDNINELDKIINSFLLSDNKMNLFKKSAKKFSENNFYEIEKLFFKIENNL